MSWLSISEYAKSAINDVQKRIDKVLDIQEEEAAAAAAALANG